MESVLQDVRFAVRMLGKSPAFTLLAVLAIALGVGANTAIFTVVNAVLIKPLPYSQPGQLVAIWGKLEKEAMPQNWISEPEYWDLKKTNQAFSAIGAYATGAGVNMTQKGTEPARFTATYATASLLPMLGVTPALGRTFSEQEDFPGRDQVAVLTYSVWKTKFGGDTSLLGRDIDLNGKPYTVVGVLPEGFSFGKPADLWLPLGLDPKKEPDRGSHYLRVVGRIKPGVSIAQAQQDVERFAQLVASENPDLYRPAETGWGAFVRPMQTEVVGKVSQPLRILLGAVALVLLIACANVANLLLVKASARQREFAVRAALGASRSRLVRQVLTEATLLSLMGGAVGLLFAVFGTRALLSLAPASIPRLNQIRIDQTVLLFTAAVSFITGILFGIAPSLHVLRSDPDMSLKGTRNTGTAHLNSQRTRSVLVVSEIALALVLLVSAGLLIRSFQRLLGVDPGFRPDHLLTLRVSLPETEYKADNKAIGFYTELTQRVSNLPGVNAAGAITELPMSGARSSGSIVIEDRSVTAPTHLPKTGFPYIEADRRTITPGYFSGMQVPVVSGRTFTEADSADAPRVVLVDAELAQRFWPGQSPIGKRIAAEFDDDLTKLKWCTIVGVVAHVRHDSLDTLGREQVYIPLAQQARRDMYLAVRTNSDPQALASSIRSTVLSIDPAQPIYEVATMDELLQSSMSQPRFNFVLLSVLAGLALLLAAIGIYGVLSYLVTLRWQELGIRMALGAQRADVLRLVLSHGLRLVSAGLIIGLTCAFIAARLLSSMLFGISSSDLTTFLVIPLMFLAIAAVATALPALRATRVEPMIALRHE
jgi:predicted permease